MAEVDLERLAAAYHLRSERGVATRMAPVLEIAGLTASDLVVDVGGGRGAHAAVIAAATGAHAVVLDPSRGMVTEAADRV